MIRVGVSGTGQMGRLVLEAVAAQADMQPVAALEPRDAAEAELHLSTGVAVPIYRTVEEMLAAAQPDVIVDFTNVPVGSWTLGNVGPDEPFGGGVPGVEFPVADPATTQFIVRTGSGEPLSVFYVATEGLSPGPGWTPGPGPAPLCDALAARLPPSG